MNNLLDRENRQAWNGMEKVKYNESLIPAAAGRGS